MIKRLKHFVAEMGYLNIIERYQKMYYMALEHLTSSSIAVKENAKQCLENVLEQNCRHTLENVLGAKTVLGGRLYLLASGERLVKKEFDSLVRELYEKQLQYHPL